MTRYLAIAASFLVLTGAPAASISIKWHGQSFFEIKTSKGTVIAIDPHNIEGYGRREVKADIVLVTHFHIDHNAPQPITNLREAKVFSGLKNPGGAGGKRKDDEFNEFDEKVKDVRVQAIGCYHDKMQGMQRGKNSILIIEVDGLRIVHLGDLGHTLSAAQIKKIGKKVDVLMVPVGGVYSLNGADAKEVVKQLEPTRFVIPMHYSTRVYEYVQTEEEFLDEQDEKWIKKFKTNELLVDTSEVEKKRPLITVLSYEEQK